MFTTEEIEARVAKLGLDLDLCVKPSANYVPYTTSRDLLFISGQVSIGSKGLIRGKLGGDLALSHGYAAARLSGINIISQLKKACAGDWSRVIRCIRLQGLVNSVDDFEQIPKVIDGASDIIIEVFGDAGRHARTTFAVRNLPRGAAVEVDALFQMLI